MRDERVEPQGHITQRGTNVTESADHHSLAARISEFDNWRKLYVDPTLADFREKIDAFEEIKMQITGAVKFIKVLAASVGVLVTVLEVARLVEAFKK